MPPAEFAREDSLQRLAVLVPAWQPDPSLVELVRALAMVGFAAIVLVDDGSSAEAQPVFAAVAELAGVHLLRHASNLGKGRALKTGLAFLQTDLPEVAGFVTADADGQHAVADITRVAAALDVASSAAVLGVRSLRRGTPLRSRVGNALTRWIFAWMTGVRVADTQTGLRAFPRAMLPELLAVEGERYEYEMSVLVAICRHGRPVEVPIRTIYIEGNIRSHFDPFRDSMRIYFVLVRYCFSSLGSAAIDFAFFALAYATTGHLALSIVVGRISSMLNFAVNKRFVFHSRAPLQATLGRYFLLASSIGTLSYGIILCSQQRLHWNVYAAKVVADVLLSVLSFSAQRIYVFERQEAA